MGEFDLLVLFAPLEHREVDDPGQFVTVLVDELQVIVCPVVVGGGKRFFPEGVRLELKLLEERSFGSGVALLRYSVEGY